MVELIALTGDGSQAVAFFAPLHHLLAIKAPNFLRKPMAAHQDKKDPKAAQGEADSAQRSGNDRKGALYKMRLP
jgi:hypothetical protein